MQVFDRAVEPQLETLIYLNDHLLALAACSLEVRARW
jgi:hypothetical protein